MRRRLRARSSPPRSREEAFAGNAVECPVCGGTFARFIEPKGFCPRCLAKPRQRLVWVYLTNSGIEERELSFLHVAPEASFRQRLSNRPAYVAGDLDPERYRSTTATRA